MKVLLVIDMQNESYFPQKPFEADEVVSRINNIAQAFRKNGDSVIFIQHDGTLENCYLPGSKGWEILSDLQPKEVDHVISKTANDSFYKTELKDLLVKLNVLELVITGSATDFCVDATIKSALTYDFNVTVISNAHTTQDRPALKAKQVIDHYNWVWRELSATKHKVNVVDEANYLLKLRQSVS
ncbi:cysteine hydrolase family protein [Chryseosolibacter indicus]|uniref:Cysteine hydrolase n=1 Tax=Chryseosolibacter indicus TaxID=2782351 RepID=A0ABS5VUQ1_9BACT|nr:cysteine hydrolase family protein [Chryseosolibacter indicus]MBT1705160.1 cysteine hydrolase [Chryseosolibacter indicus]